MASKNPPVPPVTPPTPPPQDAPPGPTQADVKKLRKPKARKPRETPVPPELQPPGGVDPQVAAVDPDLIEGPIGKIQDEILKKQFGLTKGKKIKPAESPPLTVATRVIPRFVSGKPTAEIRDDVAQVTESIEDKFKILDGIVQSHAMEKWDLFVNVEWELQRSICADFKADKLKPLEKLALLKLISPEVKALEAKFTSGANPLQGVAQTMEKVDSINKQAQAELARKLAGTTPQGREVARRLAFQAAQMSKRLAAAADQAALQS